MTAKKHSRPRATRLYGQNGTTRRPLTAGEQPAEVKTDWLLVSDLKVDHAYQRALKSHRVKEIVAAFDPDLLGVLLVSQRSNGSCFLLDGQTRHAALLEMGWDDQRVPCLVYTGLSRKDEARIFVGANVTAIKPSPTAIFKGKLAAGDPGTVAIYDIARSFGYLENLRGDFKDGMITSPTALQAIFLFGGPDLLTHTLAVCSAAWPKQHIGSPVLKALGAFLAQYGPALSNERLVSVLARTTPDVIFSRAKQLGLATRSHRNTSQIVQIFVADYNVKLRHGRLIYNEVRDSDTWEARAVMLMTDSAVGAL